MNFCRTFLSGEATDEEKVEYLRNAVAAHKETVNLVSPYPFCDQHVPELGAGNLSM